jgi:hypothetical protein
MKIEMFVVVTVEMFVCSLQVETADGEFIKMQVDQRKISTNSNSYGFSPPKVGEVNSIPVSLF